MIRRQREFSNYATVNPSTQANSVDHSSIKSTHGLHQLKTDLSIQSYCLYQFNKQSKAGKRNINDARTVYISTSLPG